MRAALTGIYGNPIGPLAILVGEPGQVRKEAATVYDVCAGMWLVGLPPTHGNLVLLIIQKSYCAFNRFSDL